MIEYIREVIEPHLDLMTICMKGTDSTVDWFKISKDIAFIRFLERYSAKEGISSIKSISLNYNGEGAILRSPEYNAI